MLLLCGAVFVGGVAGEAAEENVAKIGENELFPTVQAAVDAAGTDKESGEKYGTTITMIANSTEQTVVIDKTVTLDLNGYVLVNNCTAKKVIVVTGTDPHDSTSVIFVASGGKLTVIDSNPNSEHHFTTSSTPWVWDSTETADEIVKGGCITGGKGTDSSGVKVYRGGGVFVNGGTFTMNNGNIVGNEAKTEQGDPEGGGVYVNSGTFTMSGSASIVGNTAENGGGVYVNNGKFEMKGTASIKGNTATTNGGGVCIKSDAASEGTFNMTGGTISGNTATKNGGGVYVDTNGTFTMNNGSIVGNKATTSGGGVCVTKGNFKMSGGTIGGTYNGDENTAKNGGGVYVTGASSKFEMSETASIVGNKATGASNNNGGGGVYVTSNGTFTLNDGSIAGNEATKDGGGVYVATSGKFEMSGGTIGGTGNEGNTATNGGGVYVIGSILGGIVYPGTFTMEGSASIKGNTATGTADTNGGGGVFVAQYGVFTMTGGTIGGSSDDKNTAQNGGGVYIDGGTFTMQNSAGDSPTHGTITGNTATNAGDGGGVYVQSGTFNMDNGNIVGNTATDGGGGVCIKPAAASKGTFNMTGGTISRNTAPKGGGVYSDNGLFDMTGGTISGNIATILSGGGVYVMNEGTFEVSGSPVIKGNVYESADNNVYIDGADKLKLVGPLSSPAEIHITNPVAEGKFGEVDTTTTPFTPLQSHADHFVADSTSPVAAKLEGTILKWVAAHTVTIDNTIQHGEITAFPAPAYTGATVTLTATPDAGYQLKAGSLTYTPEGSSATPISGNTFTMPAANVTVTAEFEIPVKKSSTPQGSSTWISTIPSVPGDNTVATDVTYQYTGQKFIPVSAANLEQISAADPAAAAAVEMVLQTASAAGIPLTNSKGAKAIVNTTESVPGTQTETFSQVIEVTSADGSKVTSVPFKVRLSDLAAKNLTTDDVTLYHYLEEYGLWIPLETVLVSTDDVYAYYEGATDGASPFGVLLKKLDAPEVKPLPSKTPVGKSPAPFAGVLAGLGAAAAVFGLRRK